MNKTEFIKDDQKFTLTTKRSFNAHRDQVWKAYSKGEILEKWWAPRPWTSTTISMDFRDGGSYHYSMNGPDGEKHYGLTKYLEIVPNEYYKAEDHFTDSKGNINPKLPGMILENTFKTKDNITQFISVTTFANKHDLDQALEMGLQEGFAQALDQLEKLLTNS